MNVEEVKSKKKKSRGFLGQTVSVIIGVITIVLLLVVANVMLGQLDTIVSTTLFTDNMSVEYNNTTAAIAGGFSLLSVALGIVTLLVVVSLLWLCVSIFMGGDMFGGDGGDGGRGGGRGRRGKRRR